MASFKSRGISGVAMLLAGSASPLMAQSVPAAQSDADVQAAPVDMQEIVVTAQKRSESAQRVAAALNVVTSQALVSAGITDVRALNFVAPGVQLQPERGATRAFIRGVGQSANADGTEPAVAIYYDEVYMPREATGASFYDLDRVEVLPGPQGTLYGRGAAGGAINIIPKMPVADLGAEASLEVGNYDLVHVSAAVNMPASEKFRTRIAVNVVSRDGYLSNGENDEQSTAVRAMALFAPRDGVSLLLSGSYYHNGGIGDTYVKKPFERPSDPWYQSLDPRALGYYRDLTTWETHAKLNVDVSDAISLTYIPAYVQYDNSQKRANALSNGLVKTTGRQYSQELRLSGEAGDFRWVSGLFWYRFDTTSLSATEAPFVNPTSFSSIGPQGSQRTSIAAFAQGTYTLRDSFRLTAGVRASRDKIHGAGVNVAPTGAETAFTADGKFDNFDFKIGAEYDVTPQNMLYVNVQTGYEPGGYSNVPATPTLSNLFDPAKVRAYSMGAKNKFFDSKLVFNIEAFYYDYKDYQISAIVLDGGAIRQVLLNADKAVIKGIDATIVLRPTNNDTFSASATFLSPKAKDFKVPSAAGVLVYDGFQLPGASKRTINVSYRHDFDLASGAVLSAELRTFFDSGGWQTYNHVALTDVPSYNKTDISLTYVSPQKRWTLAAWVKNVGNTANLFTVLPAAPIAQGYINPPRTFGGRVGISF